MVESVPRPAPGAAELIVRTVASVVSAGTERMIVEFGRAGLLGKARSQPEKVRQVFEKVRADGLGPTVSAVRAKLDTAVPLGYCQAGVVVERGDAAGAFAAGDRVVTNGPHAEFVCVPHTLAARIPDGVDFQAAAFAPAGAIALQGIRLAAPTLGETVVVYGLGLIGLLAVQLLRASGCRVIGIDISQDRLALAERFGAEPVDGDAGDPVASVRAATGGVGADAVLLTLASKSTDSRPMHLAAEMSRRRGRLVLVGVTGLELSRDDFYKKELSFSVSCSYGPGRYDPKYEGGQDYPAEFVRWTAQRNFDAVLALTASGALNPLALVTHRFAFEDVARAYDLLGQPNAALGIVLTYGQAEDTVGRVLDVRPAPPGKAGSGGVGVIGAGNFATRVLIPRIAASGARLRAVGSKNGTTAATAARKFGFERATTDLDAILGDPEIGTVFVLTRHDSHAALVARALLAGKHVFVEKPLALSMAELDDVRRAASSSDRLLMVGFNRRFAPLAAALRKEVRGRGGPLSLIVTVNAGAVPSDHWTQDPERGGGRIAGEACHFIDLARAVVAAPIAGVQVSVARDRAGSRVQDVAHLVLSFADGSTAAIHYLASGSGAFPKERVEAFFDGRVVVIDNWRRLRGYGGARSTRGSGQDKGHRAEIETWMKAVQGGGPAPIPLDELLEVSEWTIRAARLARGADPEADAPSSRDSGPTA